MSYRKDKQERFDWTMKGISERRAAKKKPTKEPITLWQRFTASNWLYAAAVIASNLVCVALTSALIYFRRYLHD